MLVIGGSTSLWGAVVGALAVSALDSFLAEAENGAEDPRLVTLDLPAGTRVVVVGRADGARPDHRARRASPAAASSRWRDGAGVTRVCVAGAGVIGSLLAGHLARVADVSVLARREEHARALERAGPARLRPRRLHGARCTAATDPAALPEPDLVIVACKGTDLEPLAATPRGAASPARR